MRTKFNFTEMAQIVIKWLFVFLLVVRQLNMRFLMKGLVETESLQT